MRVPEDMMGDGESGSPKSPKSSRRRAWLAVVAVLLVVLLLSLRAIATFWTDFLWFDSLDYSTVWRRLLSAKVTLGVAATLVFFVILLLNLVIADRLAPPFVPVAGPEDEILVRYRELVTGRRRLLWLVVSLVIAVIPGMSASAQWREWLLFRFGGSFGQKDPQFGTDIGFYVFRLPFLSSVVDWLFAYLVVTAIAVAIVHYLNGAIRLHAVGQRVTPNAKAHLSVLLALAALVKAADYWLQRFELTTSGGRSFDGAGYTDVNATLPAIQLLILVSVFAAGLLLVNIWRKGWVLPAIVVALWALLAVVAGGFFPAFVQRFQVDPAELAKEKPYIERNIEATRDALGLADVKSQNFAYTPKLTAQALAGQRSNLDNARLLDPSIILPTIQNLQFQREYYTFRDVDVDRYSVASDREPVVISSRELNLDGVSNPSWEKLHLVFTHGYAVALAPANKVNERGEPEFLVQGIPAEVTGLPPLTRPEIYHGEDMTGYAIVGTKQTELSTDDVTTKYDGDSGVTLSSMPRRAAFALRFGEIEPLISNYVERSSKVIFVRDVMERVRTVAPFLELDQDPYPILIDGRVKYVIDGYTTTSRYPYAQQINATEVDATTAGSFNYIRNSVKAVVDAYDGTVKLYLTDDLYGADDPIIRAYVKAFPDLFSGAIPPEVLEHARYPEFMFKAQTTAWGRYHQTNPSTFFNNSDRWAVAQQPPDRATGASVDADTVAVTGQQPRIEPYYQMIQSTPKDDPAFVLTRPFVLASGDDSGRNLTAVMAASSDPGAYGTLSQVVMVTERKDGTVERNNSVDGPLQANQKMVTYDPVSSYQSLVGSRGSRVRFGNLLILPFGNSLLYLRPVYAAEEQSGRYTLKKVVVAAGNNVGFGDTLEAAIADLTDGKDNGVAAPDSSSGEAPTTTVPTPVDPGGRTAEQLLAAADAKFAEAQRALASGNLCDYQSAINEAQQLVRQAAAKLSSGGTSGSSGATSTTVRGGKT
ncbi:MAG: UPF0182 family protein [Actinomycetes bacterium]